MSLQRSNLDEGSASCRPPQELEDELTLTRLPRRALVFLLYDPEGICDPSVIHTLKGFRPFVEEILVVSNGYLQPESRSAVAKVADQVLERPNTGYDVGAYRSAFDHFGWNRLAEFDELILANYTFFGPVGSFGELFERMAKDPADFWGITNHPSITPHPYTGKGTMPEHLQSYWLVFRRPLLTSNEFRDYWERLPLPKSYSDVVTLFECQLTEHFSQLGFSWSAAFPAQHYGVQNPTMEAPLALLQDGCPLFKKRLYFHDVPALAAAGVFSGAVTKSALQRGYPPNLIIDGVARRATARELSLGMNATFVVPQDEISSDHEANQGVPPPSLRIEVIESRPWKRLAAESLDAVLGDAQILVVNRPGPAPHDLGDNEVTGFANARAAIVDNATFVAETFQNNPRLAALFPYAQFLSEPVSGRSWFSRSETARTIASELGVDGPFSHSSVLGPWRGFGAYRRPLLEKIQSLIEAAGWKRLVDIAGDEESLSRSLDLLAADIAKDLEMVVGQAATADELRASATLMQDLFSRKRVIYPDYLDYPYSGRVIVPSLKNRVGSVIKSASPTLFESLHNVELQSRAVRERLRRRR